MNDERESNVGLRETADRTTRVVKHTHASGCDDLRYNPTCRECHLCRVAGNTV